MDINKMKKAELQEECTKRNIHFDEETTRTEMIALLENLKETRCADCEQLAHNCECIKESILRHTFTDSIANVMRYSPFAARLDGNKISIDFVYPSEKDAGRIWKYFKGAFAQERKTL